MTHICLYTFGVKDNCTLFDILDLKFKSSFFSGYDELSLNSISHRSMLGLQNILTKLHEIQVVNFHFFVT